MTDTATIDAPAAIEFAVASIGRELVPVQQETSLDERAASINRHLDLILKAESTAGQHRLRAGRELIKAREHVPDGQWVAWCKANFKRGQRDIQRLMKIAVAEDPEAALEQERAKARTGMKATRAKATNVSRTEDDRASGNFRPLGPRIRNTISVPEKPDGETRSQKAKRLFLHFASEDITVCNKIMRDLPFDPVDDIGDLRSATHAVIEAWEKIDAALAMRAGVRTGARARARHAARVDQPKVVKSPADAERLKLLRERAEKNGYRLVRRGSDYHLVDKDSGSWSVYADLDDVEGWLDSSEGKTARQLCTPCGSPIPGWNNSEEWLAAHPGKTMEDFERALPPAPSGCVLAEPLPEVVAQPAAAQTEPPVVEQPESEPSALAKRMAEAEVEIVGVVEGQLMAQHSAAARAAGTELPAPTILKKASKKGGPVIRPDIAAFAAERGLAVSSAVAA